MDVSCKELRQRAWDNLGRNGYGEALGASVLGSLVGSAGGIFTAGAMNYGVESYFVDRQRGKKTDFTAIFSGFNRYGDTLVTGLLHTVFLVLWTWLFIIPGIIKAFSYSMTYYVMRDFNLSGTDAITKSRELMHGYKGKLFKLELSFLGWILLSMLTFGIGALLVAPYMQAAYAEFYAELLKCHGIELGGETEQKNVNQAAE